MKKYIHYCWFGNKKKPLFFNKIKKSWQKFLPNYKVIEWNEKNFDINYCNFSKKAYQEKKYAFVSDIARIYVLYKYGGIYLDIDMEILKNINFLINENKNIILGSENNIHISGGIIIVNKKNNKHMKNLLNIYKKINFDKNNIWNITFPKILTNYFKKLGYKENFKKIQILNKNIYIYPREYFYPLSYTWENNKFTKNTFMIHHFFSSWTTLEEKTALFFARRKMGFLVKYIYKFFKFLRQIKIYNE